MTNVGEQKFFPSVIQEGIIWSEIWREKEMLLFML